VSKLGADKLGTLKSQYAVMVRHHGSDSPQARDAEEKFAAAKASIEIKRILATRHRSLTRSATNSPNSSSGGTNGNRNKHRGVG